MTRTSIPTGEKMGKAERGRALFLGGGVEYRIDGAVVVPSLSRPNASYEVRLDAEHVRDRCGCEDCRIRGAVCVHQHAAEWAVREWRRGVRARRKPAKRWVRPSEADREQIMANLAKFADSMGAA